MAAKIDVNIYYQHWQEKRQETIELAKQITVHLDKRTDDGDKLALSMKPALDLAEANEQQAEGLYQAMCKAAGTTPEASSGKSVSRAVFDQMSLQEKSDFILKGGTLHD